jgi:hypothetical protein
MAKRAQRQEPITPRVEAIKGSTAAGPAPGNRDITEQIGEGDDGRRSDQSSFHQGQAVADKFGGAAVKRKYRPARY